MRLAPPMMLFKFPVVSPLDARGIVLVHRSQEVLSKAHALEEIVEIDYLRDHSPRRRGIVRRLGR